MVLRPNDFTMSASSAKAKARPKARAIGLKDERPDLRPLFDHYNDLYFAGEVGSCIVEWSSQKTRLAGNCVCSEDGCRIRLSEPILKCRSSGDMKSTLLHEMIHAHLFFANNNTDHDDHSDLFRRKVRQILHSAAEDQERPNEGYIIRLEHSFDQSICLKVRPKKKLKLSVCSQAEEAVFPMKKNQPQSRRSKTESSRGSNASRETPAKGKALAKNSKRKIDNESPNKSCKSPRLDLFYGVSNVVSKKTSGKAVKSTHSGGMAQKGGPKATSTEMPDVIIAWKKWCAYEPDEEIEPLIDRRLERRRKEKVGMETRVEEATNATVQETKVREDCSNSWSVVLYDEKRDSVSSPPSPRCEAHATPGSLVLSDVGSSRDRAPGDVIDPVPDSSMALVPVGELEMEPLQVAPLKAVRCFERRKKREMTSTKKKAPVTATTVCPICSKAFEFDTRKPDENAKFNTHVDECLNRGLYRS